jgi:hypothetical protein
VTTLGPPFTLCGPQNEQHILVEQNSVILWERVFSLPNINLVYELPMSSGHLPWEEEKTVMQLVKPFIATYATKYRVNSNGFDKLQE